jgi:hypothetical protein
MPTWRSAGRKSARMSLEGMRHGEYRKTGLMSEVHMQSSSERLPAPAWLPRAVLLGVTWLAMSATAATSVSPSQAEFGGQCPEGLSEGQHVTTNCSITWTDKDGKLFCFSSDAAKKSFLSNPTEKLQRAREFMAAGNVESTEKAMESFTGSDAEAVVRAAIEAQLKANGGIYPMDDARNGDHLKLAFDDIDFTRTIDGYGFFPDVKFHDAADPHKKYLIDFWVVPKGGQLAIEETRIYKEPIQADGQWTTMARQPVPWWWIPASEHPGHLATKRGW